MVGDLIPLTDWAQNAHSLTVQRGQNAHYMPSLYGVLLVKCRTLFGPDIVFLYLLDEKCLTAGDQDLDIISAVL